MVKLISNRSKFFVLIGISVIFFVLWQQGLQNFHANILAGVSNAIMLVTGSGKTITYVLDNNTPTFWIQIVVDGRRARFPQEVGSLLQPTVMILAWQFFLFLVIKPIRALKLFLMNIGIYLLIQIFFIFQLSGYHTSSIQKFLYEMLKGNFYVIALIFIIKDNIFNPVFRLKPKQ